MKFRKFSLYQWAGIFAGFSVTCGILALGVARATVPDQGQGLWGDLALTLERSLNQGYEDLTLERKFAAHGVKEIEIESRSLDLRWVEVEAGGEIILQLKGSFAKGADPLRVTQGEGKLRIELEQTGVPATRPRVRIQWNRVEGEFAAATLLVPKGWRPELARVRTVSGDVDVTSLTAKRLEAESGSGDVHFNEVAIEDGSVKTTSGDLSIGNVTAAAHRLRLSTISGDLSLEIPQKWDGRISAKTVSGDLSLPSGDTESGFPNQTKELTFGAGGSSLIEAETVSGDLSVSAGSPG